MSLPVILGPKAEDDLDEAFRWYERQRAGLGMELIAEVEEALARIGDNPDLYPEVHSGVRRVSVQRFAYGVYYRRRTSYVQVVAIIHNRRHPKVWRGRI